MYPTTEPWNRYLAGVVKVDFESNDYYSSTYNSSKTIEHCLRSIQSQTYPHIEHIIIDGGSTDGTVDIIRKYEDKIACWISEKDNRKWPPTKWPPRRWN